MKVNKLPILYKYTTTGKKQQWQIFINKDTFYTEEGIVGGAITRSKPTKCIGKNIGKKNKTSPEEQASLEAAAKHQKKLDRGYDIKLSESGKKYFEVMLAEDYKDKETGETHPWVKKIMEDKKKRKFVQPKLDGLRTTNKKKLRSREGKEFVTCPHLIQNEVTLDGELYNHKFKDNFNAIVSMIKQPKATKEDIEHARKFAEMWVYDFPDHNGPFSERYEKLVEWYNKQTNLSIILVPTYEIEDENDLIKYHKEFKDAGYEGTIVRINSGPYENKRSKQLIKYKDWVDEEFKIVGYEEGKGGRIGTIGKFILQHDKNPHQTFKSNVKGDFEYLAKVWKDRDMYIGKEATVQYFNRTPKKKDGKGDVPRFGYVIKIDRKSYE